MATITKQTSKDRLIAHADAHGWDVTVTLMPIKVKEPKPANDSYRRRRWVQKIEVPGVEVRIDNTVTPDPGNVYNSGHHVARVYFTEDGKFVQDLTRGGYPFSAADSLTEILQGIIDKSPTAIMALRNKRAAEQAERRAKEVAAAEQRVAEAQNDLDKARAKAVESLLAVGVRTEDIDLALTILQGPLFVFGLCAEGRKEADQALARVNAEKD